MFVLLDLFLPAPFLQLGGFAALVVIFAFYWRPSLNSSYKKAFNEDRRRPRLPLEHDQKKRNLRLKQRFSSQAIPENLDAIVIGSGAGGLVTASILAKTGRKVLVLEQHDQAGGCCHTFVEQGYEWDVGIHYIGQMGPDHFDRFFVDQLTEGQLDWAEMDSDFDNAVLVKENSKPTFIPMWKNRTQLQEELAERYPQHALAIKQFFSVMKATSGGFMFFIVCKLMPVWLMKLITFLRIHTFVTNFFVAFHQTTLQQQLDTFFGDDEEIKAVLGYCWGDYAVPPSEVGPGMLALLYGHYSRGAYYPLGGASEIAYTMIPVIENAGGRVLVNANVTEILMNEKKAIGVRVATSSGSVDIKAPIIISDAGVSNTFKKLLPSQLAAKTAIGRLLDSKRIYPSIGTMQIFVGLKGSQAELNLPNKNLWVYYDTNFDKALSEWNNLDLDTACDSAKLPFLFVGFPSAKDPSYNERFPGRSVCTIITASPMSWFEPWKDDPIKKRSPDYQSAKMRLARRCWDHVCELFPQLQDAMDHIDAGSPLTAQYYINAFAGETYGLDHNRDRFSPDVAIALRPRVPEIDNLYLTGQDITTCGFVSAVYSGLVTCNAILQPLGEATNLMNDIKRLYLKCKENSKSNDKTKNGNANAQHEE